MKRAGGWFAIALVTLLIVAAVACGGEKEAETAPETPEAATPGIRDLDMMINPLGDSGVSGTASFTTGDDGTIRVFISLSGASEGLHAAHIHEIGDCSAPDGTSAGGHWNPTSMDHGQWGTPPHHLGDLGNIEVDEYGAGALTVTTPNPGFWSMGTGEVNDIVGKAIIVHAEVDDFTTQPTGAAGGRIACGVITAP